jgi:hypothetical protein
MVRPARCVNGLERATVSEYQRENECQEKVPLAPLALLNPQ